MRANVFDLLRTYRIPRPFRRFYCIRTEETISQIEIISILREIACVRNFNYVSTSVLNEQRPVLHTYARNVRLLLIFISEVYCHFKQKFARGSKNINMVTCK